MFIKLDPEKILLFDWLGFFLLQLWFAKTCENDRTCPMTERYLHHWSYMSAWVIFFRKTGKLLFLIFFPWTMFSCSPEGFLIPFIPFVPLRKNATSHYETVPFQNRPFLFNWNLLNQKPLPMALLISELLMVLQNKRKAFNRKTFSERLERLVQCSTNVPIYTPGGHKLGTLVKSG